MSLSKEEKKALLKAYEENQNKKYILKKIDAKSLFDYITKQLSQNGCDHTLCHTQEWLSKKIKNEDLRQQILNEIRNDGGYCDCEVIMNCYEKYELDC